MPRERHPAVYILASKPYGTLYIGVTSELCNRVAMHKQKLIGGFTKKYGVTMLVYYQYLDTMAAAIAREKQLKEWKRAWKIELIESNNLRWIDLFGELCGPEDVPAERGSKTKRRQL